MVKGGVWWSCAVEQDDSICVCVCVCDLRIKVKSWLEGQRSGCPKSRWTSVPSVELWACLCLNWDTNVNELSESSPCQRRQTCSTTLQPSGNTFSQSGKVWGRISLFTSLKCFMGEEASSPSRYDWQADILSRSLLVFIFKHASVFNLFLGPALSRGLHWKNTPYTAVWGPGGGLLGTAAARSDLQLINIAEY